MSFQRNSSDWIAVRLVGLSYCARCTAKLCLIAPGTRFIFLLCPVLTVLAWMTPHRILFVSINKDSAVPQVICILEISRNCREASVFPQFLHVCLRAAGIAPFFKGCHSSLAKVLCWGQLHTGWSERTMIVSSPDTCKGIACSMVRVKYPAFPGWYNVKNPAADKYLKKCDCIFIWWTRPFVIDKCLYTGSDQSQLQMLLWHMLSEYPWANHWASSAAWRPQNFTALKAKYSYEWILQRIEWTIKNL